MSTNLKSPSKLQYHFVPFNLNIEELNIILKGSPDTDKLTHKVLNFYTLIVKKLINNIFFDEGNTKYVFLNRVERRCLIGEKYVEITQKLVAADYLIEDPKWIYNENGKGNHTKKYALPKWMLGGDKIFKQVEISKEKSIQNMINRFNGSRIKTAYCIDWRDEMHKSSDRIMLHDTEESRAAIQEHLDKINNNNKRFKLKLNPQDIIDIFNHCALRQINVDWFGKRLHTKITNLPKKIRAFLYFENRPTETLGCVDIVNSQPVFMSVATDKIIDRFTPELQEAKAILSKYQQNAEVVKFKEICADGSIYESIMEYFKNNGIMIDRNQAKPICYIAFFGNYLPFEMGKLKSNYKKLAYEFLKSQYNGMYKMFKEMKMGKWGENNRKQYANNCILAQRLESQIFYSVIVPAIWNAGYRDFSTIHDSIIAPEKDCEAIRQIMMVEFNKLNIRLKLSA